MQMNPVSFEKIHTTNDNNKPYVNIKLNKEQTFLIVASSTWSGIYLAADKFEKLQKKPILDIKHPKLYSIAHGTKFGLSLLALLTISTAIYNQVTGKFAKQNN